MKKLTLNSVVFPLWLIIAFPSLILLVLPLNFFINSLIILIWLPILKIGNIKTVYRKIIIKIWIISIVADIIGSLLLILTQILGTTPFIYENFTVPLSTNPYSNPYAFIYCTFAIAVSAAFIYFLNCKISFIDTGISDRNKAILSLVLAIVSAPYLFYLPTNLFIKNDYQSFIEKLEKFRGSIYTDSPSVDNIINIINQDENILDYSVTDSNNVQSILMNYKDVSAVNYYAELEEEATILFNLINDLDIITFNMNDKEYSFYYSEINKIYSGSLALINVDYIKKYYRNPIFNDNDTTYLGNVNGIYNLIDQSTLCSEELAVIYEDANYIYSLSCSQIDYLFLITKTNEKILLKEAFDQKLITINDLLKTNLYIHKETK